MHLLDVGLPVVRWVGVGACTAAAAGLALVLIRIAPPSNLLSCATLAQHLLSCGGLSGGLLVAWLNALPHLPHHLPHHWYMSKSLGSSNRHDCFHVL